MFVDVLSTRRVQRRRSYLIERGERITGIIFALAFILLGLPLFLAVGLLVLISDGRPIFYRGPRLGKDRRSFVLYKFRTLKVGAQKLIGGRMVSGRDGLAIRWGTFLRDTRLDELPQLFNILKGDLNFIGPRPLRAEVYDALCKDIAGYDLCFTTKPGLIGCSQIFTPHATTKRLRAFLDHRFLKGSRVPIRKPLFILFTILAVLRKVASGFLLAVAGTIHLRLVVRRAEKRRMARERPPGVVATVQLEHGRSRRLETRLVDLNEDVLRIRCPERIIAERLTMGLRVAVLRRSGAWRIRRRRRIKQASCSGTVLEARSIEGGWDHVISYRPSTPFSHYLVQQYLLRKSLVNPFSYPRAGDPCSTL